MVHAASSRFLSIAALLLAMPAAAQNYGPQPGYQPGPYQQPNPYQLGPTPPTSQPASGPSLIGTWSGQSSGQNGLIQQADSFGPDGRFMSVGRLPNGFLARLWGIYRTTPVGPNQLRLETQLQGWLPQEICQQPTGQQPQCQPFQLPAEDTSLVTFSSPDQFQSMSQTGAGNMLNETRDNQPALLQAQAPQRWVMVVQPSPAPVPGPSPAPVTVNPRPYLSPTPAPHRNACPNDDIQSNVCKYSGRLVTSGGCLRCVN